MGIEINRTIHTKECVKIIDAYLECNKKHTINKYRGYCDPLFSEMKACFQIERSAKQKFNTRSKVTGYIKENPEMLKETLEKMRAKETKQT